MAALRHPSGVRRAVFDPLVVVALAGVAGAADAGADVPRRRLVLLAPDFADKEPDTSVAILCLFQRASSSPVAGSRGGAAEGATLAWLPSANVHLLGLREGAERRVAAARHLSSV